MFEDTMGVITIRKSKNRQHNGQRKKDKRTNNDLQNTTQKTNGRATPAPQIQEFSGRVSSSCSTSGTYHVNLVTDPVIS